MHQRVEGIADWRRSGRLDTGVGLGPTRTKPSRFSNTAIHSTKDRDGVLGTYSIDANGDTTLTDYGSYTIKDGELVFDKTIKAATH